MPILSVQPMRPFKIFSGLAVAGALLFALPNAASAGPGGKTKQARSVEGNQAKKKKAKKHKKGHKLQRFCAEAKCSEAQLEKLKLAFKGFKQATKADREGMKEARYAFRSEFQKDAPDEAQLKRLTQTIRALESNIGDEKFDLMMEVHAILKPAQRKHAMRLFRGGHKGKPGKRPSKAK